MKPPLARNLIYLVSRHSNWKPDSIEQTFRTKKVYSDRSAWITFIELFLAGTGAAFFVAGIIFFFAFNWDDIPKFAKFALLEGLLVAVMAVYFFSGLRQQFKNILLTAAAMLVGALFAVYGQIYQTGANGYDFFLGWTYCIFLWVVVSKYHPLWLIFLFLVNTTFWFFTQQIVTHWPQELVFLILFLLNAAIVITWEILPVLNKITEPPYWFPNTFGLLAIGFGTFVITFQIWGNASDYYSIFNLLVFLIYGLGLYYGIKHKRLFYLAVIPFSLLIMLVSFLFKLNNDTSMFLFTGLLVIGFITLQIKLILNLKKQWHGLTE